MNNTNTSREKISIFQFMKMYPDNIAARKQFEQWRWGDTTRCPHCDSLRISASTQAMPYRCKDCRKRFSVRTNTVMAASRLDYQTWLMAIYMVATGIRGVASTKLASELDITQKAAWHLGQRIRKAWETDDILKGIVECDETYMGVKEKNKHADKKLQGRGVANKQAVVGIKERSGTIRGKVTTDTTAPTLQRFIADNVETGATVYTDDHRSYIGLRGYNHGVVNHSAKEYVNDMAHTNGIESFWALLKRGYHGTFHHISNKHLQRYVNEFATRQGVRKANTIEQMRFIVKGMEGKQLQYKELVA